MEKKVPKNQKYGHVQGRLDTGLTVDKVRSVSCREFAKRRDEIFFRLSPGQLNELLSEYESDDFEHISESIDRSGGRGEPTIVTYSEQSTPRYDKPYLILDIRDVS